MKGATKGRNLRPTLAMLLLLVLVQSAAILHRAESQRTLKTINSPVAYPLPTTPEPVLLGGPLRVEVDAGPGAGSWAARLTSDYGSSPLSVTNSSYAEGEGWALFLEVPSSLKPELYSLNIAYSEGGETVNYTQPRSVWVLDEWPERLTIGQITDTHLPYGADVLARYVYEMNLIRPDIVIVTGDIVDIETIASAWQYLQNILDRLRSPSFLLPGNHDYAGAQSAIYQRYGGQLNYSVVMGNFLFIALDTHTGGYVELEQLQWAERVLREHPDKVKIMGFHHPLFIWGGGGNITGSWDRIGELKEFIYSSWWNNLDEAREMLRLIEEYDVRLILSGHEHIDTIFTYNNKHHFVATTPCGGSLYLELYPDLYYGYRLIEVDDEGNVEFDAYAEKRLLDPPNSIPLGRITYYYGTANDGTRDAVSATVVNHQERELEDVKLEFLVSAEHRIEEYTFYPAAPTGFETVTTERGHLFTAHMDVPPLSTLHLTLAAAGDDDDPAIEVELPAEIEAGKPIPVAVDVADEGWGVRDVEVSYSMDGGETWADVDLPFALRVSGDEYVLEYPTSEYELTLPGGEGGTELLVRVEARDFAGNSETFQAAYTIGPPPTATYTLSFESYPIAGVPITLNGVEHATPYSTTLEEGEYTVTVPLEVTMAGETYNFARWEDGTTDTTKTIDLSEDTALVLYYEAAPPPTYTLSIESSPITGVTFTLDGQTLTTPYSTTLDEGEHTVTVPQTVTVAGVEYGFDRWGDGATSPTRTIDVRSNVTLSIHYEEASKPPSPPTKPTFPTMQIIAVAAIIGVAAAVALLKIRR